MVVLVISNVTAQRKSFDQRAGNDAATGPEIRDIADYEERSLGLNVVTIGAKPGQVRATTYQLL